LLREKAEAFTRALATRTPCSLPRLCLQVSSNEATKELSEAQRRAVESAPCSNKEVSSFICGDQSLRFIHQQIYGNG
jgi:hypothetical protein